jgi:HAMP domain-containing protein
LHVDTIRGASTMTQANAAGDRMRRFAPFVLFAALSALASTALAFDNGQYEHVPPDIRAWFKSVIAPNGVPCCDISDGHRTEYNIRGGAYWVPIEGQWMAVPERAVIRDRGNPVGEAVVWYVHHRGSIIISCFVPADAV